MLTELLQATEPALDLWCQSALWSGAALVWLRCWPGASAARRQFVSTLALAGLLALPVLTGRTPAWSLLVGAGSPPVAGVAGAEWRASRGATAAGDASHADAGQAAVAPVSSETANAERASVSLRASQDGSAALDDQPSRDRSARRSGPGLAGPPARAPRIDLLAALGVLWGAGALLLLAPLAWGRLLVWRWSRGARPAPATEVASAAARLGLTRTPPVLVGAGVPAPVTCGALRPVVLLPSRWVEWPASRRQLVLLHELGHVARGDAAALVVARLGLAAAWWQPLAWLVHAALRRDTELACDDTVLASDPRVGADYARCLVDVAREGPAPAWVGGLAMARPSLLERRLRALLDPHLPRRDVSPRLRLWGFTVAPLLLGVCAGLDVLAPPAAAAPGAVQAVTSAAARSAASTAELVVALDGSGTHATLAEALAAASAGDTIRLGPGTHVGGQRVEVAVTLVGAGPGQTVLAATWAVDDDLARDLEARFREADDAGREALRAEARDRGTPVVLDLRVPGITVEALTVSHPGQSGGSGIRQGAAVRVLAADTVLRRVAVVHTLGSGVAVEGDAGLVMEDCLVARCQATGVAIGPGSGRVELRRCDVRDGYHRGVTIGRDDVLVEGCRISGSAWHGIRYDGCSPTIRGNALFANERFGIYASGTTAALVEGNLFVENGMAGMSCWFRNGDTIRGNTFVRDARAALEVLGQSRPTVQANVFAWAPVAVFSGNIGGSSPDAEAAGLPALAGNLVFGCGAAAQARGDTAPAETLGLLLGDPGFADAPARDFVLLDQGAAALAGVGAGAPASLTSPWPLQPGERDDAPSLGGAALDTSALDPPPAVDAYELSQPWIEALHGDDEGARFAAVEALRRALLSDDDVQAHAALVALQRSADVEFERASLRPHLESLARRLGGAARVSAFYVLGLLGPTDADRELLRECVAAPDEALRHSASHLLTVYHRGDLRDPACEALLLALLETSDRGDLREVLRGLWGARISAPVVTRVLALSETPAAYDALYFTLSTLPEKSDAVVARLLREVDGRDAESIGRCLWGLRTGVSEAQRPTVVARLLALLEQPEPDAQREAWLRSEALDLLGWVGDADVLPRLDELVGGDDVHPVVSRAAGQAARRVRQRLGLPAPR